MFLYESFLENLYFYNLFQVFRLVISKEYRSRSAKFEFPVKLNFAKRAFLVPYFFYLLGIHDLAVDKIKHVNLP